MLEYLPTNWRKAAFKCQSIKIFRQIFSLTNIKTFNVDVFDVVFCFIPEVLLEPSQTSKMELLHKMFAVESLRCLNGFGVCLCIVCRFLIYIVLWSIPSQTSLSRVTSKEGLKHRINNLILTEKKKTLEWKKEKAKFLIL